MLWGGGGGVSHPLQLTTRPIVNSFINNQFPPWQVSVCFLFLGKYKEKCVLAKAKLHFFNNSFVRKYHVEIIPRSKCAFFDSSSSYILHGEVILIASFEIGSQR